MRPHPSLAVAPLLIALLAACGGSSGATKAAPSPSPVPSSTAPADAAAAQAEVTKNWESFFNGQAPAAEKPGLLQDSAKLGAALSLAAKNPDVGKTSATVKAVTFTSPSEASVTYDILSAGKVVLPGAGGKAVLDAGTWKVSAQTFCQLTTLASGQTAIPGCS